MGEGLRAGVGDCIGGGGGPLECRSLDPRGQIMTPTPVALGMTLCDHLIIEEGTGKASLIGCFGALAVSSGPSPPHSFWVYTDLTDGAGRGVANLSISRLDTDEVIRRYVKVVDFNNRFAVIRCAIAVTNCRFPVSGKYLVTLDIDGELVAHRAVDVKRKGDPP
jgi:hypothetical protein